MQEIGMPRMKESLPIVGFLGCEFMDVYVKYVKSYSKRMYTYSLAHVEHCLRPSLKDSHGIAAYFAKPQIFGFKNPRQVR